MDTRLIFLALYFFFIFISFYHLFVYLLVNERKRRAAKKEPKVLFLIPAFNEEENIAEAVLSAKAQDFGKVDVVVIDDGSTDKTGEIAKSLGALVLRKENEGNKAKALNFGLKHVDLSKYDFVVVLDADTVVPKDYLRKILKYFGKDVAAVVPVILPKSEKTLLEKLQKFEFLVANFSREVYSKSSSLNICPTGTIFRTGLLKRGFAEDAITEDLEIGMRLVKQGYKIAFAPDVKIFTQVPSSPSGVVRQRLRWYYGFIKESLRYPLVFLRHFDFFLIQLLFWINLLAFLLLILLQAKSWFNELLFNLKTGFDIGYYLKNIELPNLKELLGNSLSWVFFLAFLLLLALLFISSSSYGTSLSRFGLAYVLLWWAVIGITQIRALLKFLFGGEAKWWR